MPGSKHNTDPVPGRVYALKRGSTWRLPSEWVIGASGTSGNPIVFTAYGTASELPRVTVLRDLKGASWSSGGGTNVYYTTIAGTDEVRRLYVNGVGLGQASSSAWVGNHSNTTNWVGQPSVVTCTRAPVPADPTHATVGNQYNTGITKYWRQTTDLDGNTQTLYFYSPGGAPSTLPSVEGLVANVNSALRCTDKSYVYIDRIDFSGGAIGVLLFEASATATPTDVRVTNCNIWGAKQAGIRVWSSSTNGTGFSNGKIKWNRVDSGEGVSTKPTPDNVKYGADQPVYSDDGVMGNSEGIAIYNGVQGWEIAQNDVSNFWHANISVTRTFLSGDPANQSVVITGGNIVEHNTVHSENINYSHGIEIASWTTEEAIINRHDGAIVRKNKIYNMPCGQSIKAKNVLFYGNLIMGIFGSPRDPYDNTAWNSEAITVFGYDQPGGLTISGGVAAYNTFVNCGGVGMNMVGNSTGAVPTGFLVANNIMAYCGPKYTAMSYRYAVFKDAQPSTSNIDVDNNLMYSPDTLYVYSGASTMTVSGMESSEAANGWTDNVAGDPLFVNYPGSYTVSGSPADYQLQLNSPARAPGITRSLGSLLPEDTSGWTNLGCWQDAGTATAATFTTGQTLSSNTWNDYTGWKGMKITVGSTPIIVTDLGRWVLSGNTQTHVVKIVNTSGVTLGSASVATSGATADQFKYAALTNPVTLSANSSYYIVSEETNGGDYIRGSGTVLSHTGVAMINNAVRSTDGVTFTNEGTTDNCSGPVSFEYYIEATFVTGQSLSSTNWNNYTGWKGMKITVGSAPIIVTQLGRWVLSGNTQSHTVKLVNTSGTTIASAAVATSGATAGQMKYVALSTPVTLSANTDYYIVSQETNGGDYWWGSNTTLNHTGAATITAATRSTDSVTFASDTTTLDHCNVPVGFKYY
ncbi:MAG TPA: DUF4082 domain-containing protein [Opitutaceae bacterium]|nr:DUF4082 domain-containing protein [Opitutaceae bacterium]